MGREGDIYNLLHDKYSGISTSSSHVFHQHGLPTATPAVTEIDMVYVVKMYM